ncbi:MAG: histidinol-phosphatase [Thermomicrobiales bacterium]|nr:histidinol-phosphatase [Thermomicrobiales bacterium]
MSQSFQKGTRPMAIVTNRDAAHLLFNVATILELAEDNPYRIRAYRRAARLLLARPESDAVPLIAGKKGKELDLDGLGERLRLKLGELLSTGRLRFYVDLCATLPDDVAVLMQIPGIGPKTAQRLREELGVHSAADVLAAAEAGKIRALYGFGELRERQLRDGAAQVLRGNIRSFVPRAPEPVVAPTVERVAAPVPAVVVERALALVLPEAA